MAYMDYEFRENDKIADVASQFNTTVEEIMRINNINPPFPMYVRDLPENVLSHETENGVNKLYLKVPFVTNGQQSFESYNSTSYNNLGTYYSSVQSLQRNMYNNAYGNYDYSETKNVNFHEIGFGKHGIACWIAASTSGISAAYTLGPYTYNIGNFTAWNFPCYPESVSDSNQASYSSTSILGRSEPFQYYTGSGPRTVSVDFTLHSDMMGAPQTYANDKYNSINYIYRLVSFIEACCYPNYGSAIAANRVIFHCTDSIHISGIITNVSTKYHGPILDMSTANGTYVDGDSQHPKYAMVDISFSITEVSADNNIPSFGSVASEGGLRQMGIQ